MRHALAPTAASALLALSLAACGDRRDVEVPPQSTAAECSGCHGVDRSANFPNDPALSAVPPIDLLGRTDPKMRGVGAHEAHVFGTAIAGPIACTECHKVPVHTNDPGHIDDAYPAEVVFGPLSKTGGANPTLSAPPGTGQPRQDTELQVTCASTYCHGGGQALRGGTATTPVWNPPDSKYSACNACHGFPPPPPHPASSQCFDCHGDTVGQDNKIVRRENHVNGKIDVSGGLTCSSCHGSQANPAPPTDTLGASETTKVTVGAHQAHVNPRLTNSVSCDVCHPPVTDIMGHIDGSPAEMQFTGLAVAQGSQAAWNRTSETCASTYCHGSTLGGGSAKEPKWTLVDGSQSSCGSCHGFPPPPPHPANTDCKACHEDTFLASGTINPAKHINGTVDVSGGAAACSACHGSAANAAPPADTAGRTATTEVTVGAHQQHLNSTIGANVACAECHVVPATIIAPNHPDAAPAEVVFGALATQGTTAAWNRAGANCNTYCHGVTLQGGTLTNPVWNKVDGTQDACGTCHGNPPKTGRHSNNTPGHAFMANECSYCHFGIANAADGRVSDKALHINGAKDVRMSFAATIWDPTARTCSGGCHAGQVRPWGP